MLDRIRSFKKKSPMLARAILLVVPVLCVMLMLSQVAFAKNIYLINDGGRIMLHSTYSTDPTAVLSEVGLELGEEDTYTAQTGPVSSITVQRAQVVTVTADGKTVRVSCSGGTVAELLARMGLELGQQDVVSAELDAPVYDGMELYIARSTEKELVYTEALACEVSYCYDPSLPQGEEKVLIEGVDGVLECTASVRYLDGQEVTRTVLSRKVQKQPVDGIVAIGTAVEQTEPLPMPSEPTKPKPTKPTTTKPAVTKPTEPKPTETKPAPTEYVNTPGNQVGGYVIPENPSVPSGADGMPIISGNTITTPQGEVLTFTKKLDCVATAYSCNGEPGITYSGTPARVGAIAVDPSFIPLGTTLYIVTNDGQYIYGIAVAEDIGGAIKGNIIDLYFNTFDECWIFGVRNCSVYVLG